MKNNSLIFKALAEDSRCRILSILMKRAYTVEEITAALNLSQPTVSFHLKKLEEAGLITKNKMQYYSVFNINEDTIKYSISEIIQSMDYSQDTAEHRLENFAGKTLKVFFHNGMLKKIPVQYKKKIVILKEFAKLFESGTVYEEKEVNEIIGAYYSDYCTIRRLLIDEGIMQRNEMKYTIVPYGNDTKDLEKKNMIMTNIIKEEPKMDRKKELKKSYKENKTTMGIWGIKCLKNNKILIGKSMNVQGKLNSIKFQLEIGSTFWLYKRLLEDWKAYGENAFEFSVLDTLKPKDEPLYDYTEDLDELLNLWKDKIKESGLKLY